LDIFVQLMCHCPEVEAPTTSKEFSTYFVDKIKRLINQEVTQHPEEYTSVSNLKHISLYFNYSQLTHLSLKLCSGILDMGCSEHIFIWPTQWKSRI